MQEIDQLKKSKKKIRKEGEAFTRTSNLVVRVEEWMHEDSPTVENEAPKGLMLTW